MKPHNLNGQKENSPNADDNILEDAPLPQQPLQAKFESMYEISEKGKTITVISKDYLSKYWQSIDVEGQAFSFRCRGAQNGGCRADQNIKVVSSTSIANQGSRFTIAEFEDYFNNDCIRNTCIRNMALIIS